MLEPTLACNIACIGCGKIREYESNKARLTVEECIDAGAQCPAPVVSICGGEPLVYKGIEDVVAGMLELGKNIDLCTNALRLEQYLEVFEPSHKLTFVVHLDGMREIHDYICDYPGLWDVAVDAIKKAREAGFRVATNTTIFKETSIEDVIEMMGYLTDDVGIDGMLIAPGLPVLADRSGADDDASRARGEVQGHPHRRPRARLSLARDARSTRSSSPASGSSSARPGARSRATRTAGKGRATCSPTGSSRPTTRCSRASSGRTTGRATIRAASTARSIPGFEPSAAYEAAGSRQGERQEHGVDADGLTFACAMTVEERIARRLGQTALVGLGASKGVPEGRLVSFGIAGALSGELPVGTVIDATRVVDESGAVLWEGGPLGARRRGPGRSSARAGSSTIPAERARLHARDRRRRRRHGVRRCSRASGRLVGCLRAISDTPTQRLGGVAEGATADGEVDYAAASCAASPGSRVGDAARSAPALAARSRRSEAIA